MVKDVHEVTARKTPVNGVVAVSLTSNRSFPRHSHDEFGIGVLTAGAQRSWSGRGMVESQPGDIITVNADEVHDGLPKDACVRQWRMLYISAPTMTAIAHDAEIARFEFRTPSGADEHHRHLFERAFNVINSANSISFEAALIGLLTTAHHPNRQNASHSPCIPSIRRAREAIDTHPEIDWSLGALAELAGMSRFQFSRAFSRATGVTPHAYVLQRRVRRVRTLIARGASLAEAALSAGFADQSHMTRALSRQYGFTPGAFAALR